ncbi:hypothetical protein G6F56_012843 [Rhizopus delemar]|nr:hypothetical protein G6F56_013521 [Rhizopus delemar]KAG1437976.1 hypothetical protein G6F56_012843 [Rhizopus delemar]
MKYAQQIANYEVVKINTAYLNGVSLQFGKKLRMFLNLILNKTNRIQALKSTMKDMGHSKEDISATVKTLNKQCTEVNSSEIGTIQGFFSCYSADYKFGKNSIYYDCVANPVEHLRAYYYLANHCESKYNKPFNCFPLRKTFVPCYMTIDMYILNTQILENSVISHLEKDVIWGSVLNMQSKGII